MNALGLHVLIEYEKCDSQLIDDSQFVRELMLEAVRLSKATIVTDVFHRFSPQGVSGVIVIAESHVTVHTWPEHGYAAVDVFTCGTTIEHQKIIEHLKQGFRSRNTKSREISRGLGLRPPGVPTSLPLGLTHASQLKGSPGTI